MFPHVVAEVTYIFIIVFHLKTRGLGQPGEPYRSFSHEHANDRVLLRAIILEDLSEVLLFRIAYQDSRACRHPAGRIYSYHPWVHEGVGRVELASVRFQADIVERFFGRSTR